MANTAWPLAEDTASPMDSNDMDRRRDRMRRALLELEAAMTDAAELARETRLAMDAVHERDRKNRPIRHK